MRQPGDSPVQTATAPSKTGSRRSRILTLVGFSLLLVLVLSGVDIYTLGLKNPADVLSPHYYMALGNSLSFGYQPNLDFSSGFADDIYYNDLRPVGVSSIVNYACAGETTTTMIYGGCVGQYVHKGAYTGPQLQAAINFLKDDRHRGHISPITLEIGANDVLPDWDVGSCTAGSSINADLATMDSNLTKIILPQLLDALGTPTGGANGDLHMLNYYNPYAKICPNSAPFVHTINDHLAADAAKFRIPVVDVYTAFGGDSGMADNICTYTWMCDSRFHDIHPKNKGYSVIADAVNATLGLPSTSLRPVIAPVAFTAPHQAVFRRRPLAE